MNGIIVIFIALLGIVIPLALIAAVLRIFAVHAELVKIRRILQAELPAPWLPRAAPKKDEGS